MERVLRHLQELGLTEYEGRVYTALVSAGPSVAGELSKTANVPYSRIYDVLSRLERRGWVEIRSGRPTKYKARPPAEVIRLLKIEQEMQFKEISEDITKELGPLFERKAEAKRPDVWVIRGGSNLIAKLGEMLSRTRVEALVSLPRIGEKIGGLTSILPILGAREISIRVLTTSKTGLRKLRLPKNVEVRERKTLFGGGVIIDGKEVLLVLASGEEMIGIWSDEIGLTRFAKEYFEYLWNDSHKT